jgi:APA family basic amino acid/polyamine antiporter/L-type amino acid transporter 9
MLFILGNAIWDPVQRAWTLAVCGGILIGIPVFYVTVGRVQAKG